MKKGGKKNTHTHTKYTHTQEVMITNEEKFKTASFEFRQLNEEILSDKI